jgi:hypothetical protein
MLQLYLVQIPICLRRFAVQALFTVLVQAFWILLLLQSEQAYCAACKCCLATSALSIGDLVSNSTGVIGLVFGYMQVIVEDTMRYKPAMG